MEKTLLVMAAGMGSRFGGLKQIEPVGPSGEFLIDYSIYDAIKAGFNKLVFIIKEENYEVFKETIGKRVEPHIQTEYVFQKNDCISDIYKSFKEREKPLGTGLAILCAKDKIHEPFAIINADDFYGYDAYNVAASYLETIQPLHYGLVAYQVANTLSPNGAAKRGVCESKNGQLVNIVESSVEKIEGSIIAKPLNGAEPFTVSDDTVVSMNLLLFTPEIFPYLEEKLVPFLEANKDNYEKAEFLIPDVLQEAIKEKKAVVEVLDTTARWYGITYREDKDSVVKALESLTEAGVYPKNLWED